MKKVKKWVYYCEFCGKKGLSGSHLSVHEKHCTVNPDRTCRLCDNKADACRKIIDKYKKYFYIKEDIDVIFEETEKQIRVVFNKRFTLQDVVNEFDYSCPNCILTVIRCLGLNKYYFNNQFKYAYKTKLAEWWEEENNYQRKLAEREIYESY